MREIENVIITDNHFFKSTAYILTHIVKQSEEVGYFHVRQDETIQLKLF